MLWHEHNEKANHFNGDTEKSKLYDRKFRRKEKVMNPCFYELNVGKNQEIIDLSMYF